MPSTIYLITGGARSGKSSYAQKLCESLCPTPVYLATAASWDDDFEQRIQRHQADRGDHWTTVEEKLTPSQHVEQFKGKVILVDCLTLWLTNYFIQEGVFSSSSKDDDDGASATKDDTTDNNNSPSLSASSERAFTNIKEEFVKLTEPWNCTYVFVTNEIGSGTHATTAVTRQFVDVQGWFNQYVASRASRVVHMVCGIPNVIKDTTADRQQRKNPLPVPSRQSKDEAKLLDHYLSARSVAMDPKGYFLIKVDHAKGVIVASFHSCILNEAGQVCDLQGNKIPCHGTTNRPEAMKEWECRTAKELTTEIFERWPHVQDAGLSVGHAAYMGREAQKAQDCLYAGKHFQQD